MDSFFEVGSFVRIPLGLMNLFGIVATVGSSPISGKLDTDIYPHGQRWLEVQLIGESFGRGQFQRGISIFPTIDDEVHLVTEQDLKAIYGNEEPTSVNIGSLAASESLHATIDLDKLISRHGAIVGSTGSGKSNAVAAFLKTITSNLYPGAQVVLIDTHSEYSSALKDKAKIFSIDDTNSPLTIPYWALAYSEFAWVLFDRRTANDSPQDIYFRDLIFQEKKVNCASLTQETVNSELITADSPIPFSLSKIWYELYTKEYATLEEKGNWDKLAFKTNDNGEKITGDKETYTPPQFKPAGQGSSSPFHGGESRNLQGYLNKIQTKVRDKRLSFLFQDRTYDGKEKDLHDLIKSWINHEERITVLDLGGVPSEIIDIVVGAITRILFEVMFWGRNLEGIGRQRPILMIYEEAHSYLPRSGSNDLVSGYASRTVRRVFKEGRKYGIGAIVVSQRPSDLDETILSQCGTFFALRLSNSEDQSRIRSAISDELSGLVDLLPALRTGEAIVVGEAIKIPSRVRLPLIEPRPNSSDPEISVEWKKNKVNDMPLSTAITNWRHQKLI